MPDVEKSKNKPLASWVQQECDCFFVIDSICGPGIEIYPHAFRGQDIQPLWLGVIPELERLIPAEMTRIKLAERQSRGG